jgi:hypothetical protein
LLIQLIDGRWVGVQKVGIIGLAHIANITAKLSTVPHFRHIKLQGFF